MRSSKIFDPWRRPMGSPVRATRPSDEWRELSPIVEAPDGRTFETDHLAVRKSTRSVDDHPQHQDDLAAPVQHVSGASNRSHRPVLGGVPPLWQTSLSWP